MGTSAGKAMLPIGVMGGTFAPIHFGQQRLDGFVLVWVVGYGLDMVRRVIGGNPRCVAEAREVQRPQPSYTVDTLTALRAELGQTQPLWLLLGADAFLGLPGWHDWRRLFELANIAEATRPGAQLLQPDAIMEPLKSEVTQRQVASGNPPARPAGAILLRTTPLLDISAPAIRGMLARHDSARYLLPDAVLDYIHEYQLYACT